MNEVEVRVARWAELAVAYSQRHGDIVVMISRTGILLVRRDVWQPRADEISVHVRPGRTVTVVGTVLQAALDAMTPSVASPRGKRRPASRNPNAGGALSRDPS